MSANPDFHAVHVDRGDARVSAEALALDARRAIAALALRNADVRAVADVDNVTASAIASGTARIPPGSDIAQRLLLLVRLHRGLGDVYGSTDRMDHWLDNEEPALHGRPRDLMRTPEGLARVVANVESRCKDCLW
ncbi:antitoxin Xre/MbcA/ParS toxin-binding domain-containing protein [Cognatilysobacter terrigena]|uniref:antitoxin Xre/MbcA/ParS toxin-binding domain-containing protein n=1 Tax=Cognatilysobacter terrigena TaxID=2488749 RepID=UPI001414D28B|nr:antitoxin Xre/MbcA/ParS toxin-binding domain-containing protein [Lysobacter terrigena]